MGGKSSKSGGFMRTSSFRKSQRNTLQKIEKKLDRTSKDIEKFKGSIDDNRYTKIKQNITEIINDLEKINATVKDKYKDMYQNMLDRCNEELQKLDAKVTSSPSLSPVASPTPNSPQNQTASPLDSPLSERSSHSVQIKLVKIALEQNQKQRDSASSSVEKTKDKDKNSLGNEVIQKVVDLEQNTVEQIDGMRKKIEYLETEIHMYKKEPEEKLYGFIRESLNDIIVTLDTLETFGNIQIKHERKLALQRAQECMKYLNDGNLPVNVKDEEEEIETIRPDKLRLSQRSTYRPITLDLNITEKLNEELHNVIHKRMEEATRESDRPINSEKQGKSTASTDESFENFDNPDSEEEFDFVNVEEDKDNSKSTPILVTSF